jgi:hypothetical protein
MNVVLSYNTSLTVLSNFQDISNGEITQYNNFPILAFDCQEKDLNFIQNLEGVICLHKPKNFRIYNRILEQLDRLCSLSELERQACPVINLSISLGSYPFEETEPMNIAMKLASEIRV